MKPPSPSPSPPRRRPLHVQFVLWMLLPLLLAFVLASTITTSITYAREARQQAAQRAETLASFAHALTRPLWGCDGATVAGVVQALARQPQVLGVALEDSCTGSRVSAGIAHTDTQSLHHPRDRMQTRVMQVDQQGHEYVAGQLVVDFRPHSMATLALQALWQQAVVFAATLIVVLAGAMLVFARIIGRPLAHLRSAILAHRTVNDNPPPPRRFADELDDVTRAYDELVHELQRLARHDPLTGLGNRRLLHERLSRSLQRAARKGSAVSVLLLDLDGFKPVNDTHGHAAGDALLQAIARRLLAAVRTVDTVARAGGDEFVIVAHDVQEDAALQALLQRVQAAVQEPLAWMGTTLRVGVSIGIAHAPRSAAPSPEALLARADQAMYTAKQKRRGFARRAPPERAP